MKSKWQQILIVALVLAVVLTAGVAVFRMYQAYEARNKYEEASRLAGLKQPEEQPQLQSPAEEPEQPPSVEEVPLDVIHPEKENEQPQQEPLEQTPQPQPYAEQLAAMDFAALQQVNGDVLGWILIPDTVVSYPLLQTSNNEYYLYRLWDGSDSTAGSIFMEWQCSGDLQDFHTIVYGHRMYDGTMFTCLANYTDSDWLQAHPEIYITTGSGVHVYRVFAAYEVSTTGKTYEIGHTTQEQKQAWIDFCLASSVVDTDVPVAVEDRFLTLSTCTGHGHDTRWVVQAVLDRVE